MKKSILKRVAGTLTAAVMCFTAIPSMTSSAASVGDKLTVGNGTNQHKGVCDGYSYEAWIDTTGGSGSMTLGKGATFKAEWSASVSSGNYLARRGLDFGSTKKATDYEYIGMDYEANYKQTGSASGNSRLCVYGWFQNKGVSGNVPLVEYYIIEDWVDWCPDGNGKMVTIDGAQYKIFQIDHTGPTINGGSETFKQYFSVRQSKRTSGHITVSDHFKAWADQGWGIGNLYEVSLNAEGWQSSGYADVTKLDVYTDPSKADQTVTPGTTGTTTTIKPVDPDTNGNYFKDTFESGAGNWEGRGDASVKTDSSNYYDGSKSLYVSGRTDNWHGTSTVLDTKAFVPGNSYAFAAAVMQNSESSTDFKMTLQYTADGEEHYDEVASVTAKKGTWTDLSTTSFEIPSGATNMVLYIEAPDSLTDFYVDSITGSKAGTKSTIETGKGVVAGSGSAVVTTSSNGGNTTVTTTKTTDTTNTGIPVSLVTKYGDANCDGEVNMADAVLIMQFLANPNVYGVKGSNASHMTEVGLANADVYEKGDGVSTADALSIQKYILQLIKSLPESVSASTPSSGVTYTNATTSKSVATTATSAAEAKTYLNASFESGVGTFEGRGDASVSVDKSSYYSGSQSLYVSNRTDNWNGAAISLSTSEYVPGTAYSFSAAVMQATGSSTDVQMTLQYTLDGEDNYDKIASATAKDKTWTALSNTSFTIPKGATNVILYVELPDSLGDYYLDDVTIASDGTPSKITSGGGVANPVVTTTSTPSTSGGKVDPSKPMMAISFDDGTSQYGTRIVDALAKQGFRATFFYVGDWITDTSEVKHAYESGMEIANHTTSHPHLPQLSSSQIRSEYDQTYSKLKNIIGAEPSKLMRLPYLESNATVQQTLSEVPLISCSIDTQDWNGASKDQIVSTIKNAMNNKSADGAIILCHETYANTAAAIEEIAPYASAQGWQIVTISEMFAAKGKSLNGGQVYTKAG